MCLPRAVCPPIASLRAWMCPPFALPPRPLGHPLDRPAPDGSSLPRSRLLVLHLHQAREQAVPPRRRPHATSALSRARTRYTPPPPLLAHRRPIHHLRRATCRRHCSPTGGRFTNSATRHAAATAHQPEADSPTPPRDTLPAVAVFWPNHGASPKPAAAGRIPAKSGPLRRKNCNIRTTNTDH